MPERTAVIQGLIELHIAGKGGPEAVASMKQILAQTKEAEKAVGGFGAATTKATGQVGALESSTASLGRTVAGYFAAGVVANFLRDSYLGFARLERASGTLRSQVEGLGGSFADVQRFLQALGAETGQLDATTIPALGRLVLAFGNIGAAQEALTLAAQFAEAGFGELQGNVDAISVAFQTGMFRSLSQFGIKTKDASGSAIDLATAIDLMREKAQTFAGRSKDAQDRVEGWRRAWYGFTTASGAAADAIINGIIKAKEAGDRFFYTQSEGWKRYIREARVAAETTAAVAEFNRQGIVGPPAPTLGELAKGRSAELAKEETEKKAAEALKVEREKLAKIRDLNEQTDEAILKTRIDVELEGSEERLALELELNEMMRAAAIQNAKDTGADVAKINALFDALARARVRAFAGASGAEPAAGAGGEDPVLKAARERAAAELTIAEDLAEKIRSIEDQKTQWRVDAARAQQDQITDAASRTGQALASIFAKNKGFAIGMAIMDTSSAIMQVWADRDGSPWYVKLAKTIALAAEGAAQIQRIRSASIDGSGSVGGGVAASSPSPGVVAASPPPSATIAPDQSISASSAASAAQGGTVVNIQYAFGDRQAMVKLAREIDRVRANDPSVLR